MSNIVTKVNAEDKLSYLDNMLAEIKTFVMNAAQTGTAAHDAEKGLYKKVFELGLHALEGFFVLQGSGDIGESLIMPDGNEVRRLEGLHKRSYRCVFGEIIIYRAVYGSREKSKIECVPLDVRLQLPQSEQSHTLQEISQFLCVEMPYKKSEEALERFLPVKMTVDTLERITREQSMAVEEYRDTKPEPKPEEEGELLIITADGKGIPIKQPLPTDEIKIEDHRFKKGPKPNRKRMAVVGAIYSVDRYPRKPEEIIEALFRDPTVGNNKNQELQKKRPLPQNKEVVAYLDQEIDGIEISAPVNTFDYLKGKSKQRQGAAPKEMIFLFDGQPSLWEKKKEFFGKRRGVEILDLLHVNGYLWDVANLMHQDNKGKQIAFMKDKILKMLEGNIGRVIGGFKQRATKLGFSKAKQEKLEKICNYLEKNKNRMKYDKYLSRGYPIATGIVEGACRHYVKDRMERAGMRWTMDGAQSMLDMRSIFLNGDWAKFQQFRIQREAEILYPYKSMFDAIKWPMAA